MLKKLALLFCIITVLLAFSSCQSKVTSDPTDAFSYMSNDLERIYPGDDPHWTHLEAIGEYYDDISWNQECLGLSVTEVTAINNDLIAKYGSNWRDLVLIYWTDINIDKNGTNSYEYTVYGIFKNNGHKTFNFAIPYDNYGKAQEANCISINDLVDIKK